MGASNAVAPRRKWRNRCAIFFFASACVCFNPHPPVGGGCNCTSARLRSESVAFQSSPAPWGAGATVRAASALSASGAFQSSPARGGGCNQRIIRNTLDVGRFQSSPARGGRVQLQQAFAMHGAFQRFNPHPPVGAGATAPSAAPMPGIARFQSSPARGGGCNPYPQHTPSASVVASGWSVGREWGWIQMEQMERQFGKSHLRRVFWGFFGSICSICSICSMRAARQKSPAPCLGGARLAVRGAIIPNCDHARKVGGNASPACNSSAPFEIIHNGRCIPAKLGCYSARINQSNPSL